MAHGRARPRHLPVDLRTAVGIVLVPTLLVAADLVATRTALKYLLLPPFAALAYLVFVNPARHSLGVRQIVLAPTATAAWAWLLAGTLGYHPVSVGLAVIGTMAIMWLLRAHLVVPPIALALLTLLLHREVRWRVDYLVSVFVFTVAVYALYRLSLRIPAQEGSEAEGSSRVQAG